MGQHYKTTYGLDNVGLRFTVVYGPGRVTGASAYLSEIIEKAALGIPNDVPYSDQVFDWVYVKDVVKGITLACDAGVLEHMIFNICGSSHSIRSVVAVVKGLVSDAAIEVKPGSYSRPLLFSIERAKRELGYEPSYCLEEGVEDRVREVRRRARKNRAF